MVDTVVLEAIILRVRVPLSVFLFFGSSLIGRVSSCHGEVCGFKSRLPRINIYIYYLESSLMVKIFVFKTKDKGSNPFFPVI